MIITQFKFALVLTAILLTVSIAAKAVGSLQPLNPTMRGFTEDCQDRPKPCWYSIVLKLTTREKAEMIGGKLGHVTCRFQFQYSEKEKVDAIEFHACDGIRLGDLVLHYASLPTEIATINGIGGDVMFNQVRSFTIQIPYPRPNWLD